MLQSTDSVTLCPIYNKCFVMAKPWVRVLCTIMDLYLVKAQYPYAVHLDILGLFTLH